MTNKVIKGAYADFKLVKTRGVIQMIIEIPVGPEADAFMEMFGLPNPQEEIWVAVAELNREMVVSDEDAVTAIRSAGMLCQNQRFGAWLRDERGISDIDPADAESVAVAVRAILGVKSRTEMRGNPDIILAFNRLKSEFDQWVMGV